MAMRRRRRHWKTWRKAGGCVSTGYFSLVSKRPSPRNKLVGIDAPADGRCLRHAPSIWIPCIDGLEQRPQSRRRTIPVVYQTEERHLNDLCSESSLFGDALRVPPGGPVNLLLPSDAGKWLYGNIHVTFTGDGEWKNVWGIDGIRGEGGAKDKSGMKRIRVGRREEVIELGNGKKKVKEKKKVEGCWTRELGIIGPRSGSRDTPSSWVLSSCIMNGKEGGKRTGRRGQTFSCLPPPARRDRTGENEADRHNMLRSEDNNNNITRRRINRCLGPQSLYTRWRHNYWGERLRCCSGLMIYDARVIMQSSSRLLASNETLPSHKSRSPLL